MCLQFCFNGCWLPDYKWWVMGKTLNVVQPQTKWWTQTSVFIHTGSLLLHKVVQWYKGITLYICQSIHISCKCNSCFTDKPILIQLYNLKEDNSGQNNFKGDNQQYGFGGGLSFCDLFQFSLVGERKIYFSAYVVQTVFIAHH